MRGSSQPTATPVEPVESRTYFAGLNFARYVAYPTGRYPAAIAAAELTTGGLPDVLTADYGGASLGVLTNAGNGTFAAPVLYPTGNSPTALATGDLNGDGHADVVVANLADNSVSVLMGNGDGTVQPQVTYPVGVNPEGVVVADVNGDGLPDVVTVDQGDDDVSVLLNAGDGTFAPAANYPAGLGPDAIAVGDLNADGHPDLVTLSPDDNALHVLLNTGTGTGTFAIPVTYDVGDVGRAVAIADVTGDGRPDVIVTGLRTSNVSVFPGSSTGILGTRVDYQTGAFPFAIAIGDVSGDNRPDVVTADNRDKNVGVLRRISGDFSLPYRGFKAGPSPQGVALADVNADGKLDILLDDFNSSRVDVLLNTSVFLPLTATTEVVAAGPNPVAVGKPVTLTATVTPAAASTFPLGGLVQFYDGQTLLGAAQVPATGTVRIRTTELPAGTDTVDAIYGGNGHFSAAARVSIVVVVQTAAEAMPVVAATAATLVASPTAFIPGDVGSVRVDLADTGDGPSAGSVIVGVYATPTGGAVNSGLAIPLGTATETADLPAGGRRAATVPFQFPTDISSGTFAIGVSLTAGAGLTAAEVGAGATVPQPTTVTLGFGNVGRHRNYALTRTLAGGGGVTLSLVGPGSGTLVDNGDGTFALAVGGTTYASRLTVTATAATLAGLVIPGPIGTVVAAGSFGGSLLLTGGVRHLTLGDGVNAAITLGGTAATAVQLASLTTSSLAAAAPLSSLLVTGTVDATSRIDAPRFPKTVSVDGLVFDPAADLRFGK